LNFLYFNVGRIVYLQIDAVFAYILLGPTIVAGSITLGTMNQIIRAFGQVRTSFQYLITSWTTIVDLISIYLRLRAFESTIAGDPLDKIESVAEPAGI
jgi:peptide/bleomycin uptake transporter